MAFLDKFNDWYVRSIPEPATEVSVTWWEPVVGARYRWRAGATQRWLMLLAMFALLVMLPNKRTFDYGPIGTRLIVAAVATGFWGLISWAYSYSRTQIFLTAKQVCIGTTRGGRRLQWAKASSLTMEEFDGWPVLVFTTAEGVKERIYVHTEVEREVVELLVGAGRLKGTAPSTLPLGPSRGSG